MVAFLAVAGLAYLGYERAFRRSVPGVGLLGLVEAGALAPAGEFDRGGLVDWSGCASAGWVAYAQIPNCCSRA